MDAFRLLAEQRIRDAIERGDFDTIEGKGRPLQLIENPCIPRSLRAAYKLLRDAGLRPREVDLMREVARLKGSIEGYKSDVNRSALELELANVQTELDILLGRNVPCRCSRRPRKRRRLR